MDINVLLVDDDINIIKAIKRVFDFRVREHAEENIVFRGVSSAKEALEMVDSENIDIVFTDYRMPEMNGVELARAIRKKGREIKIVLLSGDLYPAAGDPGVFSAILSKPVSGNDIIKKTVELCANEKG